MWLIYVQSLLDRLEDENVDHYAYADDVAIVAKISTEEEITNFNRTLEILLKWGTDYEMIWGAHKTQRLAIRYQNCGAGKPPEMFFCNGVAWSLFSDEVMRQYSKFPYL